MKEKKEYFRKKTLYQTMQRFYRQVENKYIWGVGKLWVNATLYSRLTIVSILGDHSAQGIGDHMWCVGQLHATQVPYLLHYVFGPKKNIL